MPAPPSDLDMVERHIVQGEGIIASQHAIIERLRRRGLPTEEAEALMQSFEWSQSLHWEHRTRLLAEQGRG